MWLSPAKLNLGLRIVGRRVDGYHLLESLFWPITFCDGIRLETANLSTVHCVWDPQALFPTVPLLQNQENLVGLLLERLGALGVSSSFKIQITKKIPIGGGLGGVSSNVGTVLRFLVKENFISPLQAETLALSLGADIPFFLNPVPSWVTGIGENRKAISFDPHLKNQLYFLLVLFPFGSSTPLLFERYRKEGTAFSAEILFDMAKTWDFGTLSRFLRNTRNDLEPLACLEYPLISRALELLKLTEPVYSGLSGTGSTCFGIYSSLEKRSQAAKEFHKIDREGQCRIVFAETY